MMRYMRGRTDGQISTPGEGARRAFAEHSRRWESFKYVYPVVSRRSRGLSIGVNLNPDTICNFDCVYCQVQKQESPRPIQVDLDVLRAELGAMLEAAVSGALWKYERFASVDASLKRINDIAFSGDGEPTSAKGFAQAVDIAAELKQAYGLSGVKIILITNATLLDRPGVEAALKVMDNNQGEVWAKLDAGTDDYYKLIDRSTIPLRRVLSNILACGKRRALVIQSLFMALHGEPLSDGEFDAYADRVAELIEAGCRIKLVQLYTVARKPLEPYVSALSDVQLTEWSQRLSRRLGCVPDGEDVTIEVFGGCA